MPYNDDTDRFCPTCRGARFLHDISRTEYGTSAFTRTACWNCYVPAKPEALASDDDLLAAAQEAAAAKAGMTAQEFRAAEWAEYHA